MDLVDQRALELRRAAAQRSRARDRATDAPRGLITLPCASCGYANVMLARLAGGHCHDCGTELHPRPAA